jgi:putative inorganic carbon (hco3(-)) transporter
MRDFLIIAIVLAAIPVGLINPYYGVLVYSWISYMYPHKLAWDYAQTFRVAYLSALTLIVGFLVHRPGDAAVIRMRENVSLILVLAAYVLSSLFSIYPNRAWPRCQDLLKMISIALIISIMLTDRTKVRQFLLVIALSLGFYGFKGGLFGIQTGGENIVWGPGSSIIGANNAIGVALNMCLPLLWYLARGEGRRWLKWGLRLTFFLTIPAIMFTYSRGSVLGLGAVLLLMLLKSRKRYILVPAVVVLVIVAIPYLPERWTDRQQSTVEYENDESASSRLGEWVFCWRLAMDRPFTGGGFALYSRETYLKYHPEFLTKYRKEFSAHSIYFGLLAEHGFPGFFLFFMMIFFCFHSTRRIKQQVRGHPDLEWLRDYSDMIQLSLVGFLVNGAFVELEYFEMVYHIPAVIASMRLIAQKSLSAAEESVEVPSDIQPVLAS